MKSLDRARGMLIQLIEELDDYRDGPVNANYMSKKLRAIFEELFG